MLLRRLSKNSGLFQITAVIAIPIMLQNLVSTLVNMLDTIMVGNLGSTEIAAVGLANQIFFMFNMILFGIGSGGGIFTAQFWGKKDIGGIHKTMGVAYTIALVVAALFTGASEYAPEFLIGLYSKDVRVIELGATYLRYAAISYPMMAISFVFMLSLRSTEQVIVPLKATIISLSANLVLNYVFIFGLAFIPAMGVAGAGLATVFSRLIEIIYIYTVAYKRKFEVAAHIKQYFSFNGVFAKKYFAVALPVIINEAFWSVGITMHNIIFARAGTDAIAAYNITGTIAQLTWVFFMGVGNAAAVIIGKKIGENNLHDAYSYANRFQIFMPVSAVFIGFLLFPLSHLLPVLFKVEPHIIQQAQLMLLVLMCSYPIKAFNMGMIVGVCRSGGDTVFAAVIDVVYLYAVSIPLGILAAWYWNLPAWIVYIFILSEEPLKTISGIMRLRSKKWLHNVT